METICTSRTAVNGPESDMNTHCTLPRPNTPPWVLAIARPTTGWRLRTLFWCLSALLIGSSWTLARAADHADPADHAAKPTASSKTPAKKPAAPASEETPAEEKIDLGNDIKKALRESLPGRKKLTLVITDKPEPTPTPPQPLATAKTAAKGAAAEGHAPATPAPAVTARSTPVVAAVVKPKASREYIKARAAALAGHAPEPASHADTNHGEVHWTYSGKTGPQAWAQLKPEFNACAIGKRQTPINIEDSYTLQGPAEPLLFNYQPSNGTVVNNGHTIQVNLQGNNTLTVRGSTYSLVQFHFHTPSEEQVNYRSFAMVAHLVHKNDQGQLAVVAVLLDPGEANPLIDKVWTYMPLDVSDEVRTPAGLLDLDELLPKDQRYYQFMGSLTTPPCTEGVLWMVLKTPTQISQAQLRLFQQLYPNNARPVQAVNGRPIRNAQ